MYGRSGSVGLCSRMAVPALGPPTSPQPSRSYSRVLRTALFLGAVVVALLPIPVAALGLLPVYRVQARFLMFYSPIVCLLILAYLFYVRDSLARLMFANILNPLSSAGQYYRPPVGLSLRRAARSFRTAVLALLPAVLLATSFYCAIQYTSRLNDSVDLATATWVRARDSLSAVEKQPTKATAPRSRATRRSPGPARDSVSRDSVGNTDTLTVREQVLRTAGIDQIPIFTELAVLYIGIFAAALVGLILMSLKEYAKDAMGLSEEDLVLGGLGVDESSGSDAPVTLPPQLP